MRLTSSSKSSVLVILLVMLFVLIIFSSLCYATSPLPKILLVDDDSTDDNSYRSYYTDALDTNGYSYDTFKVDDTTGDNGPQYSQMQNYDIVVWFTGESSDTLTDTDIGNLTAYFDNGGNLFLSSIYAGLDISTHPSNFYKNYLHAIYNSQIYKNDVRSTDLNSYINNPISDSLSVKLDFNVHSSDQISSINTYDGGAYVYNIQVKFKIFRFLISKSKTVAINADNQTFKVVYLGLGLESVITPSADKTSEQIRAEMMNNIMNYLYTPNTTISDIDPLYTSANTTIYADCYDPERFSYINATEYYIDTNDLGDGNNTPMNPSDGSFNTNTEEANITISTTGLSNGNHTVFIHCQDKDGHWGKYDNMTFWVDRTQPPAPSLEIKDTSGYTNTEIVSLNLTTTGPINGTNLYYIAFSCNDSAFTDDYTIYESDQNGTDYLTYHINLTDTGIGCSTADGPRTIHIRAKSRANVENTTHNTDTTILDRIPPSFTSVNISDPDTYYKAGDTITLDINMGEPSLVLTANLSALSTDSINFPPIQNLTDDGDNTYSFTTSPLNPATMLEGLKTIKITATDRAGNSPVSDSSLKVTLDKTAPNTPEMQITDNTGYTNDDTPDISITVSENPPDYISFSCDNITFSQWYAFSAAQEIYNQFNITNSSCGCGGDESKTIYLKAKDTAGNINATYHTDTTILDRILPQIDTAYPSNNSNITEDTEFLVNTSDETAFSTFSFNSSGDEIFPNNITGDLTQASYNFIPSWLVEGINDITMKVKDIAGNIDQHIYSHFVDNTDPQTTDNYTLSGWQGTDLQVSLNCTDISGTGCNITKHCVTNVSEGECTPDIQGTIIGITCQSGDSCRKQIYYNSTDYSGNTEQIKSSGIIEIDKAPPEITIENPHSGDTLGSMVQILTTITDENDGTISYASYNITNTSSGISVANGTLTEPNDWDTTWNSTNYSTGTFNITVFANDSLGNNITESVIFFIDNNLPSANIYYPDKIYTNSTGLALDLKAQTEGVDLDNCSYDIYNSTGTSLNSSNKTNIHSKKCNFTDTVDISSWPDGNYTINFTTVDESSNTASDTSWFYLDRIKPEVCINTLINNTWNKGTITINYNATDNHIDYCKARHKNGTSAWSSYTAIDCGREKTHNFDTSQCDDTTNPADICLIEFYADDFAGNINNTVIISIMVDNSPPNVTINSPPEFAWNNSDFTVTHTETDPQGQNCSYKIENTSASTPWFTFTCSSPITLEADTYCLNDGYSVCKLYINSTNNVNTSIVAHRYYSIDRASPQISVITLGKYAAKDNDIIEINATVSDTHTDVDAVFAVIINTTGSIVDGIQLQKIPSTSIYNSSYTVAGSETGDFTINITANDTVGNNIYNDTVEFYVKNTPPNASGYSFNRDIDTFYNDIRIIYNSTIIFSANFSDSFGIDSAVITINRTGTESNHTLIPENSNYTDDTWSAEITGTENEGLYIIQKLYVNDSLGNTRTLNSAEISKNFTAVKPCTQIEFNTTDTDATRAGVANNFSATLIFNKTISNSTVIFYIPPNDASSNNTDPVYLNNSNFSCTVSTGTCSIEPVNNTENQTLYLSIAFTGLIQNITIANPGIRSSNILKDTIYNWSAQYDDKEYKKESIIKVPKLNITTVACNGTMPCLVDQNVSFNISAAIKNERQQNNYTGDSYNIYANLSRDGTNTTTEMVGDINSNSSGTTTFEDLIEHPGTYQFTITAWDGVAEQYLCEETYGITVKDTLPPEWSTTYIVETDKIYINETMTIYTALKDNVAVNASWATIKKPDGNETNTSMGLISGGYSEGTWKLDYNRTDMAGTYNITAIYANDSENNLMMQPINLTFEVKQLKLTLSAITAILNMTDTLEINATVSDNVTDIEYVKVNITKPRGQTETITLQHSSGNDSNHTYSGQYTNISQSGNYILNITASARKTASDTASFFANYGTLDIVPAYGNDSMLIPLNKTYNHSWYIIPVNGDILNMTAEITISNETIANITASQALAKSFGNITYEDYKNGYLVKWELNTTFIGLTNITLNATSLYDNNTHTMQLNVTDADTEDPSINSYSTRPLINLNETITITSNVTDNTIITEVKVEITYPDATKENMTAEMAGIDTYSISFQNINQTGIFSYRIYAKDISGNENISGTAGYFTATDLYILDIVPGFETYNKGDSIDINVLVYNANNESISGFNMTLNLTKPGSIIEELVDNAVRSTASYNITVSDLPTSDTTETVFRIYTITASASRHGNSGNSSKGINVTNHLVTTFVSVSDGEYYAANSKIPLTVKVTNMRGMETHEVLVFTECSQCANKNIILTKVSSAMYADMENLIAPAGPSSFGVTASAVDLYKNGEGRYDDTDIVLTTNPPSGTDEDSSGNTGGDASPGFIGGLIDSIFDTEEKEIIDFTFNAEANTVRISQGDSAEIIATLENTGDVDLNINSSYILECCNLTMNSSYFIKSKNKQSVIITVYTRLAEVPGIYKLKIKMNAENIEKEEIISVRIQKNILITTLESLQDDFERIKRLTSDLNQVGINVSSYLEKLNIAKTLLDQAQDAIVDNDVSSLETTTNSLYYTLKSLDEEIAQQQGLKWILENKYNLVGLLFSAIIFFFVLKDYIMPFILLSFELQHLKSKESLLSAEEKSTEKEYFTRVINRETFIKIITEKHETITDIRTRISQIRAILSKLIRGHHIKTEDLGDKYDMKKELQGKLINPVAETIKKLFKIKIQPALFFIKSGFQKKQAASIPQTPIDISSKTSEHLTPADSASDVSALQKNAALQQEQPASCETPTSDSRQVFNKIKKDINKVFDDNDNDNNYDDNDNDDNDNDDNDN